MRLIDADELRTRYPKGWWGGNYFHFQIDNSPTVEAIPIEWIEKNYSWLTMAKEMIKHWREENESRDTESIK